MIKLTRRKLLILISIGTFVTAASQIFFHYVGLPDLTKGLFFGFGIGILLVALIFGSFKTAE